jgi:hypothetical protein
MNLWGVIAFILALAAVVAVIVLYIIYFTRTTPTDNVTWKLVQGSASSPSFTGDPNTIYNVPTTFSGTITVTKPGSNVTNNVFVVNNIPNTQDVTLTSTSGISVINGAIPAGVGATFLWVSSTSIQRVS